jgi:hypothetical protein
MFRRLRSSPSLLVAVLALVALACGTALAGSTLTTAAEKHKKKSKHSDAKADAKLFASLLKKATNAPKLTVRNARALGNRPASAYQRKSQWALVNGAAATANGPVTILAQSGGITAIRQNAGAYYVNFGQPVTGRAVNVTLKLPSTGFIAATPCGGAVSGPGAQNCLPVGTNDNNHLLVETRSRTGGSATDSDFYVTVEAP